MAPISSGVGASIETYAKSHGVPVIDYDRLTLGGDRQYYVSFDNVQVGKLIGQGMEQCLVDWKVASPQMLVMRGAPTDNNATLFAQGYMDVLKPGFDAGKYKDVAEPAGTWDPATARTTFEEQFTAHNNINAAVVPNDDNANAVISYLKTLKVPPRTFPDDRAGRNAHGPAERARRLPVRLGLQADLPRGAGFRRAGALSARRCDAPRRAGQRPDRRFQAERPGALRAADPDLGDAGQYRRDRRQGRIRRQDQALLRQSGSVVPAAGIAQ